jgi:hypothetical protein
MIFIASLPQWSVCTRSSLYLPLLSDDTSVGKSSERRIDDVLGAGSRPMRLEAAQALRPVDVMDVGDVEDRGVYRFAP